MINILVVIPYPGIGENYEKAIGRIRVKEVNFSTTYAYGTGKKVIDQIKGYDIVVVRGMTYLAVRNACPDVHVVEIPMSNTDILDALYQIKKKMGLVKVGIILPDITISGSNVLKSLTGFDVDVREVHDEDDVNIAIDELLESGCKVIVGGLTVGSYAGKRNIPYEQLMTSDVTITRTIKEALNAAMILDKERTRAKITNTIVNSIPSILIAVNRFQTIIAANDAASLFFSSKDLVGHALSEFFPDNVASLTIKNHENLDIVQSVKGTEMLVTQTPFSGGEEEDGILISMQKVEQFFNTEKKVRDKIGEKGLRARYHFSDIVADNIKMRQLIAKAIRYAQAEGNVLLTGETGTGKELFVQSMHNASQRADGPFVAINCAAISEQLLESELFGYADGAFTGARKGGKRGLFELAHGGTIFLDEIGEMPLNLQAKLLRVLQEKEIRKVGGDEIVPVDVRIMSATNQNIPDLVEKGLFRRDLYYRINLLALHIPPLRERGGDIDLLFQHFIRLDAERMHIQMPEINTSSLALLHRYKWDGNIRELRNVAERIIVLNGSLPITDETILSIDIPESETIEDVQTGNAVESHGKKESPAELFNEYNGSGLSLSEFAKMKGISRTTLWRKLKNLASE